MRLLLVLGGLSITVGCGGERSSQQSDEPVLHASQITLLPARGVPTVTLVAVDDSATADGRELRAAIATDFREHYESSRVASDTTCQPRDPASPEPVRRYAIVLAPSAHGDEGIRAFVEAPSLAWVAIERRDDDARRWSDAVAQVIESSETADAGDYEPMARLERWVQLLAREAEPQSERERAIVDALPTQLNLEAFLASTRDDDEPRPATDYRLEPRVNCAPDGVCAAELRRFMSGTELFENTGFLGSCKSRCGDVPIVDESTGAVECRVLVASRRADGCTTTPAWAETSLTSPELETWLSEHPDYRAVRFSS